MNDDGHYHSFSEHGTSMNLTADPAAATANLTTKSKKAAMPFTITQQHVKNVSLVIQCEECEM